LFDGDDPSRIVRRDPVSKLGISVAEKADLANAFANRVADDGRNVLPVFHRKSRAAGVHLPEGVQDHEVFGTIVDAFNKDSYDALRLDNYNINELKSILGTPTGKKALAEAKNLAGDERYKLQIEFDDAGNIIEMPDMKTWDYIKRAMDDVVYDDHADAFGRIKPTDAARSAGKVVNSLKDELDDDCMSM